LIVDGTITAPKLSVTQLSAITANLGSITAGDIQVGTSPAVSGTTMTGTGTHLYSDGRFVMGNSSTNIAFNGTTATLNGFTSGPQVSVINVNPFASTINLGSMTLTKPGFSLVSMYGIIQISQSSPSSFATWRYLDFGTLNIELRNSVGTVLYTFSFNYSAAATLSYTPPIVGPLYAVSIREQLSAFIPLNLAADTYSFYASAGLNALRDSSGNSVLSSSATTNLSATLSIFQVCA
jgi:hypothetical protein